ncbi:hypothetical protein PybrP1_006258 [[Pythium] brassicae (nom. inval.)]|nr:hypothetical protein PybrP1_006258 [[Pythium] brassicae (nom. inval.)]
MKPTRGKRPEAALPQARRLGVIGHEKPARLGNPVELTRVKLQGLPDGFPSTTSMWSSEGIARSTRLYQRSSSTPPSRPSSAAAGGLRDSTKTDMVQLPDPAKSSASSCEDNQIGEGSADNQSISASIGLDIQRSWSAPPTNEQDRSLEGNQDQEQTATPLTMDNVDEKDLVSDLLGSTHDDVWGKPTQGRPYNFLCDSPDHSDTHIVSDLSYDSTPGYSNQDSNVSSSVCSVSSSSNDESPEKCRLPPGFSYIDTNQDEVAGTPAGSYSSFAAPSLSSSMFQTDEVERMAMLRIGSQTQQQQAQHEDAQPLFGYSFNDMRRARQVAPAFSASSNFYRSRSAGRGVNQPAYLPNLYQATQSPYASSPHSSQPLRGHLNAPDQSKLPWAMTNDVSYNGGQLSAGASEFNFTGRRYGSSDFSTKPNGGIYGAMRSSERFNTRDYQPYFPVRQPPSFDFRDSYQHQHQHLQQPQVFPHPSTFYRSKPGGGQRSANSFLHPVAHSYSSNSLLEEFSLASKSDKWELSTIKGHLLMFAKDQSGSRFIQQKLEKADDETKNDAFEEVYPNALTLMTDVFGNYVIQKFFEHGTPEHQQRLAELTRRNMVTLALQVYGCRVIQRALEVTQVEEQLALMKELHGHVKRCIEDQNGNHVLQKCIEVASWTRSIEMDEAEEALGLHDRRRPTGKDIQFIIDDIVGKVFEESTHSYGCRVVQRILEHCSPTQIRPIVSEIVDRCRELMKDQFGNYVVQHVIRHGEPDQRRAVMDAVFAELPRWSMHKFASNVVEACFECASKAEISRTVEFILQCDETGASCPLLPMMKHMYGNYVVQKLMEKANSSDRARIVCIIRHNADYLKRFTFGKHVLNRLEREAAVSYY